MNSTFNIEKDFFFDSIWNPSSSHFQKYGRKYLRRVEMFDYKLKSQNETVTIYEYKGTISKNHKRELSGRAYRSNFAADQSSADTCIARMKSF